MTERIIEVVAKQIVAFVEDETLAIRNEKTRNIVRQRMLNTLLCGCARTDVDPTTLTYDVLRALHGAFQIQDSQPQDRAWKHHPRWHNIGVAARTYLFLGGF